jgi:dienelactone hydrolase
MKRRWLGLLSAVVFALVCALAPCAVAIGLDPAFPTPALGPELAKGVMVWSHGRSFKSEDSQTRTPPYLHILRDDGWDVMRFNRLRVDDTLSASSRLLVEYVNGLKQQGYRRIILGGQSFGAFLALMAADQSEAVDAVIATAPAAFGRFDDAADRWRMNATRLYPLLESIQRARVMLFYFHGDDFDPGGRGDRSREILSRRGLGFAVIDQPHYLTGHWAASSGLFLRRFAHCVRDFADAADLTREFVCTPRWGASPSAELKLPPELTAPSRPAPRVTPSATREEPAGTEGSGTPSGTIKAWYGFYTNGREVLLALESQQGDALSAVYAIGPSIDGRHAANWTRRQGRLVNGAYVFDEAGLNRLHFQPRDDGGMTATWTARNGDASLTATLRRIDARSLVRTEAEQ